MVNFSGPSSVQEFRQTLVLASGFKIAYSVSKCISTACRVDGRYLLCYSLKVCPVEREQNSELPMKREDVTLRGTFSRGNTHVEKDVHPCILGLQHR